MQSQSTRVQKACDAFASSSAPCTKAGAVEPKWGSSASAATGTNTSLKHNQLLLTVSSLVNPTILKRTQLRENQRQDNIPVTITHRQNLPRNTK